MGSFWTGDDVLKALIELTLTAYDNFSTPDAAWLLPTTCNEQPEQQSLIDVDITDLTFSRIMMMDNTAAASSGQPVWTEYHVERSKDKNKGNRYWVCKVSEPGRPYSANLSGRKINAISTKEICVNCDDPFKIDQSQPYTGQDFCTSECHAEGSTMAYHCDDELQIASASTEEDTPVVKTQCGF
jgi:hypothetical protein